MSLIKVGLLEYGFCKKYFNRNEPLTIRKLLSSILFQISADLEKNGGQKCSTGQRFICTEVTYYKIHILIEEKITQINSLGNYLEFTYLRKEATNRWADIGKEGIFGSRIFQSTE